MTLPVALSRGKIDFVCAEYKTVHSVAAHTDECLSIIYPTRPEYRKLKHNYPGLERTL